MSPGKGTLQFRIDLALRYVAMRVELLTIEAQRQSNRRPCEAGIVELRHIAEILNGTREEL